MKRMGAFMLTHTALVVVCIVFTVTPAAMGQDVDWEKHLIDGVQLTGNYDTRYLLADPCVRITVDGRSQQEADNLVSGSDPGGKTGITWAGNEEIGITIDMKAERLLSGIVMAKRGTIVRLRIATSLDGRKWRTIPNERLTDAAGLVAGNLALPARYLLFEAAAAGDKGAYIGEIVAYGEKQADAPMIGGIYPSWFPPVAGKEIKLRAVIRNTTGKLATGLVVRSVQTAPQNKVLGEQTLDKLDPYSARVASIPWKPSTTEPYRIEVTVAAQGEERATVAETIPVVSRRLYFSNFNPYDNARHRYANLYTTIGGGHETFMANLRGRMGLYAGHASPTGVGAGKTKGVGSDKLYGHYRSLAMGGYRDGVAIDEFASSTIHPAVSEALRKAGQERSGRFIVPWLIGKFDENVATAFEYADVVLAETYLNWQHPSVDPWIHHQYRSSLDRKIDSARKWGMLEKQVIALGCFYSDTLSVPTAVEDIEREVQYLRRRGPEMPGVCYYGGYESGEDSTLTLGLEHLSYKYFIAPVVTFAGPWEVKGGRLHATIRNIGGMTARDVVVAAMDASAERRLGQAKVAVLPPGGKKEIRIELPNAPPHPMARILESPHYTALNPKTLEVMPERQMKGPSVRVSWTPLREGQKLARNDFVDVVSRRSGKTVFRVTDLDADSGWDGTTYHLPSLPTANLVPGEYRVRLVSGSGRRVKVSVPLEITANSTRFFVSRLNGKPWTGDPQKIALGEGDTFEVRWDMGDWQLSGKAAMCVSAAGKGPKKPGADARAALLDLAPLIRNKKDNPLKEGRWTWNSSFEMRDGVPVSDGAKGGRTRVGTWRLWFSEKDPPTTPIPWVPVITIRVASHGKAVGGAGDESTGRK